MRSGALLLGSALLGIAGAGCDVEEVGFRPPVEEGMHPVRGGELYYKAIGVGEPIVVVHGGPGLEHTYLLPGLEPLGQTFRLILYDQRGLGRSTGDLDSASISMERYVADLDAVRDVAGVERMNLLAHSWGGLLALMYALEHPDRIRTLVLVSPVEPGQRYAAEAAAAQRARRLPEDSAAIDSLARSPGLERGDPETLGRLFYHVFRGTLADPADADSLRLIFTERTAVQRDAVATLLMGPLAGLDLWDELSNLAVPVLIVHGDQDPMPVAMAREMVDRLPHARLEILHDAGHFPFVEAPGPLFGAIQRFLEEQQSTPDAPG